ncbi:MAG: CaiB/BaiF CoA-transferase family protein [Pseudomonadales bacterium]
MTEENSSSTGPLEKVKVIEITTTWAGPMAGCILADFGAEVIRVEHPDGDVTRRIGYRFPGTDESVNYHTVNRNKKSIALDLHDAQAQEIARKLVATADVLIENFRKGALERWGLGYDRCAELNPRLVYASITGFGQNGPYSEQAAYDPVIQFMSGWASRNGTRSSGALRAPTALADDLGGVHAALGVLAALRHRDVTGRGQYVDISMMDAMLFQSNTNLTIGALGIEQEKQENRYPTVPASVYDCRDGQIYIAVLLEKQWTNLANLIDRQLAADSRFSSAALRVKYREEIDQRVNDWCTLQTRADVLALCHSVGIPAAQVATFREVAQDPQVEARDMLQRVEIKPGVFGDLVGPAVKFSSTPTRIRSAAPGVGAHTEEVLESIGYSKEDISEFRMSGVILPLSRRSDAD